MPLEVHVVTAEREVFKDTGVDEVVAPGIEGELTVLPSHAPLMTMIQPGIMRIIKGNEETELAIVGGFLEVKDDRVTILADAAERADEIDAVAAEEARRNAEKALEERASAEEIAAAAASLQRSLLRLRAVEKVRRRGQRGPGGPPGV
ncbi:MAG TPA: F0F1 ATP synthase subunit epsilon [Dehalococcoidia bacterium]|nr:F0F1 ATP synthase subunit epsilon [Dehalococcoidia bacterium]